MRETSTVLDSASLPSLPYVSHEILLEVNTEETDINVLSPKLGRDPALAARIVSTANSAFFMSQGDVRSLDEAIMRLGLNRLRVLATSILLRNQFDSGRCPGFQPARYWLHAIATANASGRLARASGLDSAPGQLGGLLHSIGILLLAHSFPTEMATVFSARRRDSHTSMAALIREHLDVDHHEAGAMLLREWELPVTLCALVEGFGSPAAHDDPGLLGLVRCAADWAATDFEEIPPALLNRGLSGTTLDTTSRACLMEQEETTAMARLLAAD